LQKGSEATTSSRTLSGASPAAQTSLMPNGGRTWVMRAWANTSIAAET